MISAVALGSVWFGAITTLIAPYFAERGWSVAWLVFTVLCGIFLFGRIAFGHHPDRLGGAPLSLECLVVQAVGRAAIWLAPSAALVFAGTAVMGAGDSLVFLALASRIRTPSGRFRACAGATCASGRFA